MSPYQYPGSENLPKDAYGPVPEGEYAVIIEHAREKQSKTGKDMMELECVIQGPTRAGAHLWDYIVYDDRAARKFRAILRSCGLPEFAREITPELLEGCTGTVRVKHELYNGERRAKLHYWIESEPEPETDSDTPPPPSVEDEPSSFGDDTIPF